MLAIKVGLIIKNCEYMCNLHISESINVLTFVLYVALLSVLHFIANILLYIVFSDNHCNYYILIIIVYFIM